MNRIFRLVWNRALGTVQVASEFAQAAHGGAQAAWDTVRPRRRSLALACAAALGLALPAAPAWAACVIPSISATGTAGTPGQDGTNGHVASGGRAGTAGGDATSAGGGAGYCIDAGMQALGGNGGDGGFGGDSSGFPNIPGIGGRGGNGGDGGAGIRGTGSFNLVNFGGVTGGTGGTGGVAGLGMSTGGFGGMGGTGGSGGTALDASGFSLSNMGSVTGGAGGIGGRGGFRSGGATYGTGGTGGQGGAAIRASGSASISNLGSITGGAGGVSGQDFYGDSNSGNGGAAVTGDSFQLVNRGTVTGGAGGDGGDAYLNGTNGNGGRGGEGVLGANLAIANFGTISGGQGGGVGPATGNPGHAGSAGDAVHFVGTGNNILQLMSGSVLNGAVEIDSGTSATIIAGDTGLDLSGGTLGRDALIVNGSAEVDVNAPTFAISGNIRGIGTLNVVGAGNAIALGAVNLYALNSNATSTLTGNVTTTGGGQTYSGPVLLGAPVVSTDTQGGTLNYASIDGAYDFTADTTGSILFNGAIGANQTLASLSANHASQITLGGNVSTTGNQSYAGPVTLAADVTANAGAGNIHFGSSIDGAYNLTVATTGTADFQGALGATTALNNIDISSASIALNQAWNIGGTSNLDSGGSITQVAGAGLSTTMLTGSSAGNTLLTDSSNAVQNIGPFSANGFSLRNNQTVTVFNGSRLNGGTGNVSLTTTAGNVYVNAGASILGANITLAPAGFTDLSGSLRTTGTITLGSPLEVRNGGVIVGDIANNSVIDFFQDGILTVSGAIAGGGDLYLHSGILALYGSSTYTGATTISGVLALRGAVAGIAQSSTVLVSRNGALDISLADNGASITTLAGSGKVNLGSHTLTVTAAANDTYKGVMSGTGGFTLAGGTEIFTGANTYTGLTTIRSGTLQLGTGGVIAGNVIANGELRFSRGDAASYAGAISGSGKLTQLGTGALTLNGNSAAFSG